jgi:FtsH-binding integral membrane protein
MPGSPNFIRNTFLHLLGGLLTTALSAENPIFGDINKKPMTQFTMIIVLLGSLFLVNITPVGPPKYVLYAIMCILLGQNLTALEQRLKAQGTLQWHIFITAIVFIMMAGIGTYDSQNMLQWETYLGLTLGALLVSMVCSALFFEGNTRNTASMWINRVAAVLFAMYIGFDVEVLKENAKLGGGSPDYIKESIALYLDVINLFTGISGSE